MNRVIVDMDDRAGAGHLAVSKPLVLDLDGTLIKTDSLLEVLVSAACRNPIETLFAAFALGKGKAAFKARIGELAEFDPTDLPYDEAVVDFAREASAAGRQVYLASGADQKIVEKIATHLGFFDGWFASDGAVNLTGKRKAAKLVATFGKGGFDYVGNERIDLDVWCDAEGCTSVAAPLGVQRRLTSISPEAVHMSRDRAGLKAWLKLLRVHQYVKNGLIFVPPLAAHALYPAQITAALLAFASFSLVASSVYILNDIVDLPADRAHATKRRRPIASGQISIKAGLVATPVLFLAGFALASLVSAPFVGVLAAYYAITTAYSFVLKRKLLVDVVALAALYTMRVNAGSVATEVGTSEWLLGFSVLIFTALALVKRYVELASRLDRGLADMTNRNYRKADMPIVASLAAGAGYAAVVVLGLYISSDIVASSYTRPLLLWATCPLLLYWIGRVLILAHRRDLHDDPVVFAIKDRNSWIIGALVVASVVAAI